MKHLRNALMAKLLIKVFMNPIGIVVLIVAFIFILAMAFSIFPKNDGFNLDNPDSNRDILERNNSNNSVHASCSMDGEIDEGAMESTFDGAGVFDGQHDTFLEVAERYDFDPVLLSAIAMHETGYGTSQMVRERNNPGGLFNSSANEFFSYDTLEEGLDAMASNLYRNYYAEGLFSIADIGNKYAPIGVENDPTNLNTHWIPTVTNIVNSMGGMVMHCEAIEGDLIFPIDNPYINSDFGNRVHPVYGDIRLHGGTDFDCNKRDPIYAAQDGTIVLSQFNTGGFGNFIIIEHQENMYTAYAHLEERNVSTGDEVSAGDTIGLCGTTGTSTGDHLHFEVRLGDMNGEKVDPVGHLPPL